MATDLTVTMEDRPGALAQVGRALGDTGVNLAGACAVTAGGEGTIHLLVEDDPAAARQALTDAGIEVTHEQEVLVVEVADEPGQLGTHAARLADAGINIDLMYVATGTRLVFGVADVDAARAAL